LQHPLPITGDDMTWLTVYGSKFEFMLNANSPNEGFSSLAYPWQVSGGYTFCIDVSMLEVIDTAKLHVKVLWLEKKNIYYIIFLVVHVL